MLQTAAWAMGRVCASSNPTVVHPKKSAKESGAHRGRSATSTYRGRSATGAREFLPTGSANDLPTGSANDSATRDLHHAGKSAAGSNACTVCGLGTTAAPEIEKCMQWTQCRRRMSCITPLLPAAAGRRGVTNESGTKRLPLGAAAPEIEEYPAGRERAAGGAINV